MKVLVVDDNIDAAEPLLALLDAEGFESEFAAHPAEALEVAACFQPDVALLDISLPGMDGWKLGCLLRGLPGLGDLRLVALTGNGTPEDHQRSADAHFEYHLVKPVDFVRLVEILRTHDAPSRMSNQHQAGQ